MSNEKNAQPDRSPTSPNSPVGDYTTQFCEGFTISSPWTNHRYGYGIEFCWLTWHWYSCRLRIRRALVWTYLVRHRMQQRLCMPCQSQGFASLQYNVTILLRCLARLLRWRWSVGQLPCWQRPALMACFPPSTQLKREMIWNIMKVRHVHPHPVRKQAGPTVKKEQRRPLCCPHSYHGICEEVWNVHYQPAFVIPQVMLRPLRPSLQPKCVERSVSLVEWCPKARMQRMNKWERARRQQW